MIERRGSYISASGYNNTCKVLDTGSVESCEATGSWSLRFDLLVGGSATPRCFLVLLSSAVNRHIIATTLCKEQ